MIEQLAYELETDLILLIAKYLKTKTYGAANWRIEKLGQLSMLNNETVRVINRYRARMLSGIDTEMNASAESFLREIRATLPPTLSRELVMTESLRNIVTAWAGSAKTQTNLAMAKLAQSAGQSYVMAVSKASLSVLSGAETHKSALGRAVGELESLTAFVDKAGRQWSPEGYISTVIRSNSTRAIKELQFGVADELDTDLVEVTAHVGARPKCYPYQDHIFSLSGKSKKYPYLYDPNYTQWGCTLGMPDGLLGINCGHRLIPFVPGVSKRGQQIPRNKKANDEAYRESQQQRQLERNIRNAKREQAKWENYGDIEKANQWGARVKENQAAMRDFIKETDRTRRREREQVYT